jgi:hypothetical protein
MAIQKCRLYGTIMCQFTQVAEPVEAPGCWRKVPKVLRVPKVWSCGLRETYKLQVF